MSVKQRLIVFAKSKERSIRSFEMKSGIGLGYINAIRVSISPEKIKSIVSNYPDLNTGWLMTGDGEMLKNSKPNSAAINDENEYIRELKEDKKHCLKIIEEQSEIIKSQRKTIERLEKELDEKRAASVVPGAGAGCANVG